MEDVEYLAKKQNLAKEVFKGISQEEIETITRNEKDGVFQTSKGFGFFDASEYEPKDDDTAWIIRDILPKNSFGFVAGPPKGNASPHGGKSVFNRKMALCILKREPFFGHEILESGRVLFVNLDEDQDKQVRLYYRMTKGEKIPGYLISRARSCKLPEQAKMLEEDIKIARPIFVVIDPLGRTLGGKAVKEQSDVGPIIDELKRISKEYECCISMNHHSNKARDRDKDSTASWLNGSTDLDAAWDFCHCLEYNGEYECVHFRNFQKEKAKTDMYYEAEIINKDEIIGLYHLPEDLGQSSNARRVLKEINNNHVLTVQKLIEKIGVCKQTFYNYEKKYKVIKDAIGLMVQRVENKGVK